MVFIFLLITAFISYQIYYYQYYLPRKPKPVILPQVLWGKLPPPNLPQSSTPSANLSYTIATPTGSLPTDIPKIVKVYFLTQLGTSLTALDTAKTFAANLAFPNGPNVINQTQYQFSDSSGGNLTIDLGSGNFSFERVATTSGVLEDSILPDQTTLVNNFKSFLASKNLLKDDLKNGRSKVTYDQLAQQNSTRATLTIWPSDLNNYQIVTPDFNSGIIKAIVGKARDDINRYLSLNYTYWGPDPNTTSTYPLITPDQAFNRLQAGEATIVLSPLKSNVSITNIRLAYFESDQYSPYIEPIYVFEGENFVSYLPAIDPKYLTTR